MKRYTTLYIRKHMAIFILMVMWLGSLPVKGQTAMIKDATTVAVTGLSSGETTLYDNVNKNHNSVLVDRRNGVARVMRVGGTFTVDLKANNRYANLDKEKGRGIVVYLGINDQVDVTDATRPGTIKTLKVSGRKSGQTEYVDLGYAYFQFRGDWTHEFSDVIYPPEGADGSYDSLKLEVVETTNGNRGCFYKFNVYQKTLKFPGNRLDPLRCEEDYYGNTYEDYRFEPTRGILSHRNHYGLDADMYCTGNESADMALPWGDSIRVNYDNRTYELPTYDEQGGFHAPHITEKTLYAMPGDIIPLIPFYDMPNFPYYHENFSHWYGYVPRTGAKDPLHKQDYKKEYVTDNDGNSVLDFLIDAAGIVRMDNGDQYGFLGGAAIPRQWPPEENGGLHEPRWYGTVGTFYQPLKTRFAPDAKENLNLDKPEFHIAADFAHEFNPEAKFNLDEANKVIYEPNLSCRYVWHIKDGRTFADENTTNKADNERYLASISRHVTARAGQDFQVGLNTLVPINTPYAHTFTNFYYKNAKGKYGRVPRVSIEVRKLDEKGKPLGPFITSDIFTFENIVTAQGKRRYFDLYAGLGKNDDTGNMIAGLKDSEYHGGYGIGKFYIMLYCPYTKCGEAGTYQVRLRGADYNGSGLYMPDGSPLYLDEYVVTFVGEDQAALVSDEDIKANYEKYRYQLPDYLKQKHVAGEPVQVINFDQYKVFESFPDQKRLFRFQAHETARPGHKSFKWPTLWHESTYAFGYGGHYNYDYNEYIIANHTSQVKFNSAASAKMNADGSKGLYDRKWYDTYDEKTKSGEMGFFYYVNAANDPGITAKLRINSLCPGSTVVVSAWVAEMSAASSVANIAFNFMAVDRNGNYQPVHTFISGPIDNLQFGSLENRVKYNSDKPYGERFKAEHGKWTHVYYSFMPDLSRFDNLSDIDHYELWLENNCESSDGADYAVDDIQAFIIAPEISLRQRTPVCDPKQTSVGVRLRTRFDKLLDSQGLEEGTTSNYEDIKMHLAILDKKKYKALYEEYLANPKSHTLDDIVRRSVVKMLNSVGAEMDNYYVTLTIPTCFDRILRTSNDTWNGVPMKYTDNGTRYIDVNLTPSDTRMYSGKEYIVATYFQYTNPDGTSMPDPTYESFAVTGDPCMKYGEVTLVGPAEIEVNGFLEGPGVVQVCEGQAPVVKMRQGMLARFVKEPDPMLEESWYTAPAPYWDWYLGSTEDFMTLRDFGSSYYDLIAGLRAKDPDCEQLPGDAVYDPLRPLVENGTLVLHTSSFVFPPLSPREKDNLVYLTGQPIIGDFEGKEKYFICTQPGELRLRVINSAPKMLDGFARDIDYPSDMADVPVRVGLWQLQYVGEDLEITRPDTWELTVDKDVEADGTFYLEVPLRGITSYLGKGKEANMVVHGIHSDERDPFVYLVGTNDPRYIGIDKHPMDKVALYDAGLLPIGVVTDLTASTRGDENHVSIVFSNQMEFREGYYYRVRFNFDEEQSGADRPEGYCSGQVVFTIKVVPEYMKWNGAINRNWNNDGNWNRMAADELMFGPRNEWRIPEYTVVDSKKVDIIFQGGTVDHTLETTVKGNTKSFAPLDFTKVVVPDLSKDTGTAAASEGYPTMFDSDAESILVHDDEYDWNTVAETAATGIATKDIVYDMASYELEEAIICRPWYANVCEQIHFNSGAELLHQEYFQFGLNYRKAWVDMEMKGNRWYTMASPLEAMVAGDMYTKSATGRQDTELFTDISFRNDEYGRYAPAVYQRGWNKAEAKTYMLGDGTKDFRSSATALTWSRVYNDVAESYAPGTGFSVRTDMKGITNPSDEGTVLFRFPKKDSNYSYYDPDDATEKADDSRPSRVGNRYRLTTFANGQFKATVSVGTPGQYFLVGNPFMASMKMEAFLKENASLIEPCYWIMTDDRQAAYLWDEKSGTFLGNDLTEDPKGKIPPMQGFFVKAKTKAPSLTLIFTPAMMDDGAIEDKIPVRSAAGAPTDRITVTAVDDNGGIASRAVIALDRSADNAFNGSEDVALLIDRSLVEHPTVYTVAGNQALAINSLETISSTEVGVLAGEGETTTLVFEGSDNVEGLMLLDTQTSQFHPLYEGMNIRVEGSSLGRYYLTRGLTESVEGALAVICKDHTVRVYSPADGIAVRVYNPAGTVHGEWSTEASAMTFDLPDGLFIIEAVSANRRVSSKVLVK